MKNKKNCTIIQVPGEQIYRVNYDLINLNSLLRHGKINTEIYDFNSLFFEKIYDFSDYKELKSSSFVSEEDFEKFQKKTYVYNYKASKKYNLKRIDLGIVEFRTNLFYQELIKNIKIKNKDVLILIANNPKEIKNAEILINLLQKKYNFNEVILVITFTEKLTFLEKGNMNFSKIYNKKYLENISEFFKIPMHNQYMLTLKGIDINKYLLRTKVIPLKISDFCYYGQCAFCDKVGIFKMDNYKQRIEWIITQMENLNTLYGTKCFKFVDDAFPPKSLKLFAEKLIEKKLDYYWTTNIRLDKVYDDFNFLKLLKKAGCVKVFAGLETASPLLLKKMNKGIRIENVNQILEKAYNSELLVSLSLIFNFPSETINDLEKTIEYIKSKIKYIENLEINNFKLTKNSDVYQNKDKYNIKILDDSEYFVEFLDEEIKDKEILKKEQLINKLVVYLLKKNKIKNDWHYNYQIWDNINGKL